MFMRSQAGCGAGGASSAGARCRAADARQQKAPGAPELTRGGRERMPSTTISRPPSPSSSSLLLVRLAMALMLLAAAAASRASTFLRAHHAEQPITLHALAVARRMHSWHSRPQGSQPPLFDGTSYCKLEQPTNPPDSVHHKVGQPIGLEGGRLAAVVQRRRAADPRPAVLLRGACRAAGRGQQAGTWRGCEQNTLACTLHCCTGWPHRWPVPAHLPHSSRRPARRAPGKGTRSCARAM